MAKTYDDEQQDVSADQLRDMVDLPPGREDQLDAEARDAEARKRRSQQIYHGLNAGLYAGEHGLFGERAKAGSHLARQELERAEKEGFDFNKLGDKGWYKNELPKAALKRSTAGSRKGFYNFFVKKHLRKLMVTAVFALVPLVILIVIFFLAPFKHDHFETILRSANFARFQLLVRQTFTRVIFEASVLTQDSVGTFQNSPLVRQIRLAVPDSQLAKLGESGKVKWEFKPNGSFGQSLIPIRESLQAVVIDGERYDIDEFARKEFGKNYADLPFDQKWKVQGSFVSAVNVKLGDLLRLMPRHVRWNPLTIFQHYTGINLVRFLHKGNDFKGLTQQESEAKNAKEVVDRVMTPDEQRIKSGIPDINEGAAETKKDFVEKNEAGQTPGEVRGKIAGRARIARGVSDAVFVMTTYCITRELVKIFTPEYQAQREAQAARAGALDASGTDQDKDGAISGQARYAMNQKWDAQGDIPDAAESAIYKNLTGQKLPQNAEPQQVPWLNPMLALGDWYPAYQEYNNFVAPFILEGGIIPGILKHLGIDIGAGEFNDGLCTVMLNEYVQYGIAGGELILAIASLGTVKGTTAVIKHGFSLIFHFVAGLTLDKLLSMLIEWTIKEYAGLYFTGLAQGADRVGETYVAQNSIAQVSNRTVTYGGILNQEETNEAQTEATIAMREEFEGGSTMRRYLALDNPFSLASLTLAKLPVSFSGLSASIQNSFESTSSILSYPLRAISSFGSLLSPQPAYAAGNASTTSTYGVEQWGWTVAEQKRVKEDPSFALPALVARVEPRLAEWNARYAECYDSSTYNVQVQKPAKCTRQFLTAGNPDFGDDALYWRYYNALMFAATHLSGEV